MGPDVVNRLYELVANEEDARVCKDIPESACSNVPANFFRIIASNTLTKLGDSIINPKTVLTWIMTVIGAPVYLVALLVPIRESGSMLPQLFIASYVRALALRKWTWVLGSVLQAIAILAIGGVALTLEGAWAGWLVIAFLVVFSLARGLCSVASKDVIGKTVPKTRRGRLNGLSTTIAGLLTLAVGALLLSRGGTAQAVTFYAALIVVGASTWLLAALVYARVEETPGETGGGGNAFTEAMKRLDILRTDAPFRRFVIARALLLCSALSAPYYVILAQQGQEAGPSLLGMFVLAGALAESLSASFWGVMADRSSRQVMVIAAVIAGGLGLVAFVIETAVPLLRDQSWIYPMMFFVLGIAHSGVRLGRKTYVLDLASGQKRSDYVAVSNTVIGFILLLTGAVGALSSILPAEGIILVLSMMGLTGAVLAFRLPEAD
jgi:hypothetical protein